MGRVTVLKLSEAVRAALKAEAARRNALPAPNVIPRPQPWDMSSVAEMVIRDALGVSDQEAGG